jgi:hypothetical protein
MAEPISAEPGSRFHAAPCAAKEEAPMTIRPTLPILIGVAALSLAACGQPAEDQASAPAEPTTDADGQMNPETNDVVADVQAGEPLPPTTDTEPQVNPGPDNPPPTLPVEPAPPSTSPPPQ